MSKISTMIFTMIPKVIPKIGFALCAIALLALTGCPDGVPDTAPPVITLEGEGETRVITGNTFTDEGAAVADNDPNYTHTMAIPMITDSDGATVTEIDTSTVDTYTITYTAPADAAGNLPVAIVRTVLIVTVIDGDGDLLIDIDTLEELNAMRHNLDGTSYRASAGGTTMLCGTDAVTACIGYELLGNLDFADGTSYASGTVNLDWRPTAGSSTVVAPDSATNAGWDPIGDCNTDTNNFNGPCGDSDDSPFAARFDGGGFTVTNLYARASGGVGLFRISSGTIAGIGIVDANIYGGDGFGFVGGLVGLNYGTITTSYATGSVDVGEHGGNAVGGLVGDNRGTITTSYATGSVDEGAGSFDSVGGLVGDNFGTITASYATGNVDGGAGSFDSVGGLVGNNTGTIIASYATGDADGGTGGIDLVGGLAGRNTGTIIASYATGDADGGARGDADEGVGVELVGGLVGDNHGTITASYATGGVNGGAGVSDLVGGLAGRNTGTIIASYATGDADGGAGDRDSIGGLVGQNFGGTIAASYATGNVDGGAEGGDSVGGLVGDSSSGGTYTASYGFGTETGGEITGIARSDDAADSSSDTPPGTVDDACDITVANSSTMTTAPDNRWDATQWDFGTGTTERPLVRHNGVLVPGQPTDRTC